MKYLVMGVLMGISVPTMAQEADFNSALKPVAQAMKDNPAGAEKLAKDFLKLYKKNPEAVLALGSSYLTVKNFTKADEMAEMVLTRFKKDNKAQAEAYILKGDIEAVKEEAGNGGDAASHYATAMSLDPQNPTGYMRYASVYRKISPELVEKTYNELRKNIPGFPIEAEAGHSFFSGNKFDKAFENFAKCDIDKLDEGKLVEYLVSAVQINKYPEALKIANFGGKKFAENATFAQLGLWSAVETENFAEAENIAKRYLTLKGDKNATDYTYYGKALMGQNKFTEAIEKFNKAMEVNPEATEPLARISETYTKMGDEDKALEYSEKHLAKNKNANIIDYANLAQIFVNKAEKGDAATNYSKALSIYDQMIAKFPEYASWTNGIAAGIADKAGKEDLGAQYNQKIVDELGNNSNLNDNQKGYLKQALRKLGYYYWGEKNNLDAAKPYYEKLIQLDPNDKNAKAALGIE